MSLSKLIKRRICIGSCNLGVRLCVVYRNARNFCSSVPLLFIACDYNGSPYRHCHGLQKINPSGPLVLGSGSFSTRTVRGGKGHDAGQPRRMNITLKGLGGGSLAELQTGHSDHITLARAPLTVANPRLPLASQSCKFTSISMNSGKSIWKLARTLSLSILRVVERAVSDLSRKLAPRSVVLQSTAGFSRGLGGGAGCGMGREDAYWILS